MLEEPGLEMAVRNAYRSYSGNAYHIILVILQQWELYNLITDAKMKKNLR